MSLRSGAGATATVVRALGAVIWLALGGWFGWLLGDLAIALHARIVEPSSAAATTTVPPPECREIAAEVAREQIGVDALYRVEETTEVRPIGLNPGERVCRTSFTSQIPNDFRPDIHGYVCSDNNAIATSGDDPIDCLEILRGNQWAPSR